VLKTCVVFLYRKRHYILLKIFFFSAEIRRPSLQSTCTWQARRLTWPALCFHFANAKQDTAGHALKSRQPIDLWPRN